MPAHEFLNPSTMPATRGYTHVVETRGPSRTIYLAGQLACYPPDYLAANPTPERLLETVERFEEDRFDLLSPIVGL